MTTIMTIKSMTIMTMTVKKEYDNDNYTWWQLRGWQWHMMTIMTIKSMTMMTMTIKSTKMTTTYDDN